jgi:hypothetical protein
MLRMPGSLLQSPYVSMSLWLIKHQR